MSTTCRQMVPQARICSRRVTTTCMTRAQRTRPFSTLLAVDQPPSRTLATASSSSSSSSTTTSTRQEDSRHHSNSYLHATDAHRSPLAATPSTATMRRFSYHAAASFSGKHKTFNPQTHIFHFNTYNRVQPQTKRAKSKRPESGQDAFFIARVGDTNAIAFGVADGVGGWEESGVDPADFSHGFCDYMALAAYQYKPDSHSPPLTARVLMQKGYDEVSRDGSIPAGGSTACVGIATEDGVVEVANLGDSGFVQLRRNAVHTYSEPQTHAFNTPYQLSVVPASMLARAVFGGGQLCDYPKDADVARHQLQHGDVLVFASDGVWDNLFNQDILRIASKIMTKAGAWANSDQGGIQVAKNLSPFTKPAATTGDSTASGHLGTASHSIQVEIARAIAAAAKSASLNTRVDGPFAKEVHKYYPRENWHGGKVDDICVVVVLVDGEAGHIKASL